MTFSEIFLRSKMPTTAFRFSVPNSQRGLEVTTDFEQTFTQERQGMLNWTYLLRCSSVQFQRNVVRCAVEKAAVAVSGGKPKEASFSKRQPESSPSGPGEGCTFP